MTKFFMKLNFVGIVCTTAVLLYLLVTCTTANAAGYCCQVQPCEQVLKPASVTANCGGYQCIIEFSAYEHCIWIWCDLPPGPNPDPICRTCMIKAAELELVEEYKFREMDMSYSNCPQWCLDQLFLNGWVAEYKLCEP